jgi:hypothetical protein
MKSRGVFYFHKVVQVCQSELLIGGVQVIDMIEEGEGKSSGFGV